VAVSGERFENKYIFRCIFDSISWAIFCYMFYMFGPFGKGTNKNAVKNDFANPLAKFEIDKKNLIHTKIINYSRDL